MSIRNLWGLSTNRDDLKKTTKTFLGTKSGQTLVASQGFETRSCNCPQYLIFIRGRQRGKIKDYPLRES